MSGHVIPDIRNSYELYSRELLQTLRQTNSELSNNRSYRIYGAINQKEGLASFSMQECVLVDDSCQNGGNSMSDSQTPGI